MSVLIAIKEKGKFVVGVDNRVTDREMFSDSYEERPKAYSIGKNRNVIVGACGNIALVDYLASTIESLDFNEINAQNLAKTIIPAMYEACPAYLLNENNCFDGTMFLAIDNRAYSISSNGVVVTIKQMCAIGCGKDVAYGSLLTSSRLNLDATTRIQLAIEACGKVLACVSSSSYIADTGGNSFRPLLLKSILKRQEK